MVHGFILFSRALFFNKLFPACGLFRCILSNRSEDPVSSEGVTSPRQFQPEHGLQRRMRRSNRGKTET